MHPIKRFWGALKKGFNFLGIHFGEEPKISNTSLENPRSKLARRYAQVLLALGTMERGGHRGVSVY